MYRTAHPLFLVCETPLHAGSGKDLGIVDLPIQRERHTGFPKIEASGVKGGIRESFRYKATQPWQQSNVELAFGPEKGDLHASALGFTDARLLLFPVKSVRGVFAFITCPKVLSQFELDFRRADEEFQLEGTEELLSVETGEALLLSNHSSLKLGTDKVILEEYAFQYRTTDKLRIGDHTLGSYLAEQLFPDLPWWNSKLKHDIVILNDNDYGDFVQLSTEVITRTKIDSETGTVAQGQLFTEEFLPTDSILYTLALTAPLFSKEKLREETKTTGRDAQAVLDYFRRGLDKSLQLGGDATLGKGIVRTKLLTSENSDHADHN